jgi:prepilin peptidase CpaA
MMHVSILWIGRGISHMPIITEILLLAGLAVLLCVAALGDIRSYRIPNRLNIVIASLSVPYWLVNIAAAPTQFQSMLVPQLILITIAFVVLLAMMIFNIIGGGDAKLLLVLSFWLTPNLYLDMAMITAIAGGFLCLAILVRRQFQSAPPITGIDGDAVDSKLKQRIPYGVAIAVGGLVPVCQLILNALMQ